MCAAKPSSKITLHTGATVPNTDSSAHQTGQTTALRIYLDFSDENRGDAEQTLFYRIQGKYDNSQVIANSDLASYFTGIEDGLISSYSENQFVPQRPLPAVYPTTPILQYTYIAGLMDGYTTYRIYSVNSVYQIYTTYSDKENTKKTDFDWTHQISVLLYFHENKRYNKNTRSQS